MLKRFTSMLLTATLVAFAGCSKDDDKDSFTVTVTSADETMGTVSGGGSYPSGAEIVIKAEPKDGYYFFKWDDNETTNPRKVSVTKNMAFIASFKANGEGGGNGGDLTEAQKLDGSMSENKTLKDLGLPIDYIVDGKISVEGNACLTIEPGVTIAFTGTDGCVVVGENAGLKMVGTSEKPIVFQGPVNNQNKGSWGYIEYTSNRSDNQMEYVILKNGGSSEDWGVLHTSGDGTVSVKNCTIDGGLGHGYSSQYDNGKNLKAFENNTIKNVKGYAMMTTAAVANGVGAGNKFESNGFDGVYLDGGDFSADATLKNIGAPFAINGRVDVSGEACLTIEAGVTIAFVNKDGCIEVGNKAALKMVGTADKPITFQPLKGSDKGSWGYIEYCSTRSENQMEYVVMKNGGAADDNGVLRTYRGSVSVKNCTIDGGLGNGFQSAYDEGKSLKAFENNTIKNVKGYAMYINVRTANYLGTGNKFEDNGVNYIRMDGGIGDKEEVVFNSAPYIFEEGLSITGKCEVTVNAGVEMAFGKGSGFGIGGESVIKILGTEESPVVLKGAQDKAGYWEGVDYGSQDDENIFKNVVISDGNEYCLKLDWYDEVLKAENLTLKNAKKYGVVVSTGTLEKEVDGETVYYRDWSKAFEGGVTGLKFENCTKGNIYDNNVLDGETEGVDNVFEAIPAE